MDCDNRPPHTEMDARQCAFIYNQQGFSKWVAYHCKECSLWHVEKEKVYESLRAD